MVECLLDVLRGDRLELRLRCLPTRLDGMSASPLPIFDWFTKTAFRNMCFSTLPTIRNSGADFQQVFNWQLPDIPWHLQRICILFATACMDQQLNFSLKPVSKDKIELLIVLPFGQHDCCVNWFSIEYRQIFRLNPKIAPKIRCQSSCYVNSRPISSDLLLWVWK